MKKTRSTKLGQMENSPLALAVDEAVQALHAVTRQRCQFSKASNVMPGANTRSVLFYAPFPLAMERGDKATLWDLDGHRYDDFLRNTPPAFMDIPTISFSTRSEEH